MTSTTETPVVRDLRNRAADARLDAAWAQERGLVDLVHYYRGKAEAFDIAADVAGTVR